MSDQNHGNGSTSEEVDVLELEPTTEEQTAQGGDPLDEISDPVVRADAKKNRAIARRVARKSKETTTEAAPVDTSKFVTTEAFEQANERKAITASQTHDVVDDKGNVILPAAEVKANWAEILKNYTPRRGRATAEDIAEDIKDAVIIFKARTTTTDDTSGDAAADLTVTPVVAPSGTGGTGKKNEAPAAKLPNYNPAVQPKDWYKKPEKDGDE